MLTQIVTSLFYRGESFIDSAGKEYFLLKNQSIARNAYPDLSSIWPVNAFGSTANQINLPNFEGVYLRNFNYGSNNDPDAATRTSLSGAFPPTGPRVGTFQSANMRQHTHDLGRQNPNGQCCDGGGQDGGSSPQESLQAVQSTGITFVDPNATVVASGTTAEVFDVPHLNVWFYMCAE